MVETIQGESVLSQVASRGVRGVGACVRALVFGVWGCAFVALLSACGGGGGGESAAGPEVSTPPADGAISAQPVDTSVLEGAVAVFEVKASGDVRFQWQRSSTSGWADIAGATSARWQTAPVALADSGSQFRVRITAGTREVFSSAATLTVTAVVRAPRVLEQPLDANVAAGSAVHFAATVTGTAPTYQWQRSRDGATWVDIADARSATFEWQTESADDGWFVRVLATNAGGTVTSAVARLRVQAAIDAPLFTQAPVGMTAHVGASATFTAAAIGSPVPTLTWQTRRDGGVWADVAGATGASVTVGPLIAAQSGQWYRAVATNARGSVESLPVQLTVTATASIPLVEKAPVDATVGVGASAVFAATAAVTPDLTLQWQVSTDGGVTYTAINGATGLRYTTPAAALTDDFKRFRVVLTNGVGSTTSAAAQLRVLRSPALLLQPQAQGWRPGETEALFTARAAGDGVQYQWQSTTSSDDRGFVDIAGATGATYLHAATAATDVKSVRVVVSSAVGSTPSEAAALQVLDWQSVYSQPVRHSLSAVRWIDDTTLVAVGSNQAIYRSGDAGVTWHLVSEVAPTSYGLTAVAFANATTGVAVGGDGMIKRSTDGGRHWVRVPVDRDQAIRAYQDIAFSSPTAAVIVGSDGAVLRSTDAGETWAFANVEAPQTTLSGVAFNRAGTGLAVGVDGTVLRSINGGADWTRVRPAGAVSLTSVTFASDTVALAAGGDGKLLRSTDAGLTWNLTSLGIFQALVRMEFRDADVGIAAMSQDGLLRTTDGGVSWQQVPTTQQRVLSGVAVGPAGLALTVGQEGILRSVDSGASWSAATPRRPDALAGVAFASPTTGVAVGIGGTVLRSTDGGAVWTAVTHASRRQLTGIAFADAQVGVAVGVGGGVERTTDAGATWSVTASGTTETLTGVAFASPSTGAMISNRGIFSTRDAGLSWQPVANDPQLPMSGIAFGDASVGVAVGQGGVILHTADGGLTWTRRTSPTTRSLLSVAYASPTTVFAVGDEATLVRSDDGGLTWTAGSFGLYGFGGYTAVQFSSATDGIAVGSYLQVLRTTDGGLTWNQAMAQQWGGAKAIASTAPGRYVIAGQYGMSAVLMRNTRF